MTQPRLVHRLEAALVATLLWLASHLPIRIASRLGGSIAASIGPLLPVNRVGDTNLSRILPHLDRKQRRSILQEVWQNLGQTAAELPHLAELNRLACPDTQGPGWLISNEDAALLQHLATQHTQAVFVAGHLGNWEVLGRVAEAFGVRYGYFYRAASNPLVDEMIRKWRDRATTTPFPAFPKGSKGARAAVAHLARGGQLGILVDQKLNNGIQAPFFGIPSMSPPIAASVALRFNAPILAVRVIRHGPARFEVTIETLSDHIKTGNPGVDTLSLTTAINETLERWIRDKPGQWLWLHRRWPAAAADVAPYDLGKS